MLKAETEIFFCRKGIIESQNRVGYGGLIQKIYFRFSNMYKELKCIQQKRKGPGSRNIKRHQYLNTAV